MHLNVVLGFGNRKFTVMLEKNYYRFEILLHDGREVHQIMYFFTAFDVLVNPKEVMTE